MASDSERITCTKVLYFCTYLDNIAPVRSHQFFYDNVDQTEIDFRVKQDWFEVKASEVNPEVATFLSDLNVNKINVLVKKIPDRDYFRHNLEFMELKKFLSS